MRATPVKKHGAISSLSVIFTDCTFTDKIATGGRASVGGSDCNPNGVDTATWGEIKSLYR